MKFQNILTLNGTRCAVKGASKKRILEQISAIASEQLPDISQHDLLECLMERERMGTTGIGNGIAIPHGRLNGTEKVVCVLITTEQTINFDAIDNREVDIFIALFVPGDCCEQHLSTLQSIAKLFGNKDICKQVRKSQNDQQLFDLIQQSK